MFTPIQKIPLTKLLTLSHNKLLNDVINTLKKFDLDAMRLKDSFDQRDEDERGEKTKALRYYFN